MCARILLLARFIFCNHESSIASREFNLDLSSNKWVERPDNYGFRETGGTSLFKKHWKALLTQRYLIVCIVGAQQINWVGRLLGRVKSEEELSVSTLILNKAFPSDSRLSRSLKRAIFLTRQSRHFYTRGSANYCLQYVFYGVNYQWILHF